MQKRRHEIIDKVFQDPKYRGKHVIVVDNEIFVATTGKQAQKILDKVNKKYPDKSPAITYVPKTETLILCLK